MRLTNLTLLVLYLNSLIDSGKYDDISLEEVKRHINDGTLLNWLSMRAKEDRNFSALLDSAISPDFASEYVVHLQAIYDAYAGNERRKWGVENRGLCLLLAWTNEIIAMGEGWTPNQDIARRKS